MSKDTSESRSNDGSNPKHAADNAEKQWSFSHLDNLRNDDHGTAVKT